jgi:putative glycosyltransferase (TIGR04372 family)
MIRVIKKIIDYAIYDLFSLLYLSIIYRKKNMRYLLWHRNGGFGHQLIELRYALLSINEKPDYDYVIICYGRHANKYLFNSMLGQYVDEVIIYNYYLHFIVSSLIARKGQDLVVNISTAPNDEIYEYCKENRLMDQFVAMESIQHERIIDKFNAYRGAGEYVPDIFTSKDKKACIEQLKSIGVDDWFVCIHIRNNKYWSFDRNNKIDIYSKSIDYIHDIGGKVIVVGEYADDFRGCLSLSKYYDGDERIMMYVLQYQKFMIGTSSGPSNISVLFDVPVIMTNVTQWDSVSYSEKDTYLPKIIKNRKTNRLVTAKEYMAMRKRYSTYLEGLPESFEYLDNDEDDILAAVMTKNKEIECNDFESKTDQKNFKNNVGDGKILWSVKSKVDDSYYNKYKGIFES